MSGTETTSSNPRGEPPIKDFFLNYQLLGIGVGTSVTGLLLAAYWLVNPMFNLLYPISFIVIGLSMVVSWKLLKPMRDGVSKPEPEAPLSRYPSDRRVNEGNAEEHDMDSIKVTELLSLFLRGLPLTIGITWTAAGCVSSVYLLLASKVNPLSIMYIVVGFSLVVSWKIAESMRDEASNPEPEAI